jgi:hypothetical protein
MLGKVQYTLIAGVMFLVSQMSLTVNSRILQMKGLSTENESILAATSFAQSFLREVAARKFDERAIGKKVTSIDSLTVPEACGPDYGEGYSTFDDIDDFNGYTRSISNDRLGTYNMTVAVHYTNKASLGSVSLQRTFMKAVTVTISGPYLPKTIVMKSVVSY